MKRYVLIPAAWMLDQLAGDPEWFPHPVRLIGAAVTRGEKALRRPGDSERAGLLKGAGLTLVVVVATSALTREVILGAKRRSMLLGSATELVLAWTCLAAKNLNDEASSVIDALEEKELPRARVQLARIVGRDTGELEEAEICRAVIETLAESASDGIIAPLFYLALGGVPAAMAYKAVNTLDSMIGHADERYFYFGKAAARLDDVANLIPSRLTAAAVVFASLLKRNTISRSALNVWLRDGNLHKSPNAGQPESAVAGALQVRLGGANMYAGELIRTPVLGCEFKTPGLHQARQALRLVAIVTLLGVATATAATYLARKTR